MLAYASREIRYGGQSKRHVNSAMESFWRTLKEEFVSCRAFTGLAEAAGAIFDYIETFYNREWLHSALGFISPAKFENQSNRIQLA